MLKLLFWTASWWASRTSSYMLACICLQVTGASCRSITVEFPPPEWHPPSSPREHNRCPPPAATDRLVQATRTINHLLRHWFQWLQLRGQFFNPVPTRPLHNPMTSRGRARGVILEALMLVSAELWIPPLKIYSPPLPILWLLFPFSTQTLPTHAPDSIRMRAWCVWICGHARGLTHAHLTFSEPLVYYCSSLPTFCPSTPPTPNPWSLLSSAVVQNVLY